LVADKISAFRKFEKLHPELTKKAKAGAEIDFETLGNAVQNFELNRQIWEELDYYEEHGEVLGNHPKLRRLKLEQDISLYDRFEALNRRNNLRTYISRDSKALKKMKSGKEKDAFAFTLEGFILERDLLEKKFKLNGEK